MKTIGEIKESIIDSFVIDKSDRMLNFPCAVDTMLQHNITPFELLNYIGENLECLAEDDEDYRRYDYLNYDTIFASRMTEAYWRKWNFKLTHPNYYEEGTWKPKK
jgi:hypothetical protein